MSSDSDVRRLSRRQFLYGMAAGAGATLLAACAPPAPVMEELPAEEPAEEEPAEAPEEAEKTIVQFYTLVWQPTCIEATQAVVDNWNEENSDRIEVEWIQGSWGAARDYLTTSIAGGVTPEIIQGITAWTNDYGTQGAYLDVRDMIMQSDLGDDIHPTALDASVSPLDNKIYGVPWCWEIGMMYVNSDRFAEAGIDLPTEWNWDDFVVAAKKLTNPPDYFALAANLTATQTTEDVIAWMWQAGSEVFAEIDGVWQVDVESAAPALQLWYDFIHVDDIVDEGSFGGANTFEGFGIGVYTIRQSGCWARQMVRDMEPEFAWNMIPLPCDKRCASSSEPQTWSIGTDAVDRGTVPEAWEVIEFLCNKENQAAIAYGDFLFPTRQTAMEDPRFTTDDDDWSLALDQLQYGIAYPKHPAWAEFDERVLGPNMQLYLQGEMELNEFIDLCTEEGTRLLQTYA